MHEYANLKPKQQEFIHILRDAMIDPAGENIDLETCTSFSRSWLKYMASKYADMEWAPAWIVKDVSRRDDTKKGHYFIPELFEYDRITRVASSTDALVEVLEGTTAV
jgi:hypothetical protein|tara:strand:- start:62 stop:382 length:321 start_codon:yes stop_codon:yes gene_type:complete